LTKSNNKNTKVTKDFISDFKKVYGFNDVTLAQLLGVTRTTISLWEQGLRDVPETTARLLLLFCRQPELMDEFKAMSGVYTEVP
jgi:DNA-binding transcriptional regulator YiaG